MGFKISWIGFEGIGKERALEKLGLLETGETDEANEAPFSGAEIPGDWFILFSNDFEFASPGRLAALSVDCRVVALQVHETVMMSVAHSYERGNCVWGLVHDAQEGINNLSVSGSPPAAFQSVHQRLTQKQEGAVGIDYIFDIPVETAASVCGYQHDRWKFEWGEPTFTRLDVR